MEVNDEEHKFYNINGRFIAKINNEGNLKNATYAKNLTKLKKFVMVKNLNVSYVGEQADVVLT